MRNLLNFLAKYNNLIIFLILEGIAFYLLGTENDYHNSSMVKGVRGITRGLEQRINNTRSYFRLREINQVLASENVRLKNTIEQLTPKEDFLFFSVSDSDRRQQYRYTTARVIDNSINRQKNFFTINKGKNQGVSIDMAVTSDDGVAGVIVGCSDNFSVAMSLLNLDFRLSSRIRSSGFFGSLSWDGRDNTKAILSEIPQHVPVSVGDTIESTGFSALFPEGVIVGTVSGVEKSGGDFYMIEVALKTQFRKLHDVNVIGNLMKTEQTELENSFQ
ncbi:MAG: rod shape-determining protein MreC [Bacteroidota bacterium]